MNLAEGLTYQYDGLMCAINYGLLIIGLVGILFLAKAPLVARSYMVTAIGIVVASTVVQLLVIVAANMAGVSGIWSAELGILGWTIWTTYGRLKNEDFVLFTIGVSYAAFLTGGIIYFAVTLPVLSTVSHVLAAGVGAAFCGGFKTKLVSNQ